MKIMDHPNVGVKAFAFVSALLFGGFGIAIALMALGTLPAAWRGGFLIIQIAVVGAMMIPAAISLSGAAWTLGLAGDLYTQDHKASKKGAQDE